MLIDYREDVRTEFGEVADRFMYRNAADLNDKIAFYLAHPQERLAIVAEMQKIIGERLTWEHNYERLCTDMVAELG